MIPVLFRDLVITELELSNSRRYCQILREQIEGRAPGTVSKPALKAALERAQKRCAEIAAFLMANGGRQ